MNLKVAVAAASKAAKIIKKDRDNRYVLDKPLYVGRWKIDVPDYDDEFLTIVDRRLYIKVLPEGVAPIVDGASCFPDEFLGIDLAKAYFAHDYGYTRMGEMAEAWGWSVHRVRKLFDVMFYAVLRSEAERQGKGKLGKLLSRTLYSVIRAFGGAYSRLGKLFLLASLVCALVLSGCSCAAPDWFEPSDDDVIYKQVAGGEGV